MSRLFACSDHEEVEGGNAWAGRCDWVAPPTSAGIRGSRSCCSLAGRHHRHRGGRPAAAAAAASSPRSSSSPEPMPRSLCARVHETEWNEQHLPGHVTGHVTRVLGTAEVSVRGAFRGVLLVVGSVAAGCRGGRRRCGGGGRGRRPAAGAHERRGAGAGAAGELVLRGAGGAMAGSGPFWLRFTYAMPVRLFSSRN
jgi:hypothetical protein